MYYCRMKTLKAKKWGVGKLRSVYSGVFGILSSAADDNVHKQALCDSIRIT